MWNTASWIALIAKETSEADFDMRPVKWDTEDTGAIGINKMFALIELKLNF